MTSRREFVAGLGAAALGAVLPLDRLTAFRAAAASPFPLSVLTDEISPDLGHACEIAAREFGLGYVELRAAHGKNIMQWDANDVAEARGILQRLHLKVSELASPIFKVSWPGAPPSPFAPSSPQFAADFTYAQQDELLDRAVELAHLFETPYVRIFDFWRLDDQTPYREAIDDRLRARLLAVVREQSLKINWDPGNAAARGETPYPDGYAKLPKDRIAHMHCKDIVRKADGGTDWAAMGKGIIDWAGQLRALKRDGYRGVLSLETHWRGAGTAEESTRQSMAGFKELLGRVE